MGPAAIRIMMWAMCASLAIPFVAFALLSWFEGTPDADGPGLGLGLALICGAALIALLATVASSTAVLGFELWKRHTGITATERYWLVLGSAYSVIGGAILMVATR